MNYIELNAVTTDLLTVVNSDGEGVTGLVLGNFTMYLFGPLHTDIIGTTPITLTELAFGNYRVAFTPSSVGPYTILVTHTTYIPSINGGQLATYECIENLADVDAILVETRTNIPAQITSENVVTDALIQTVDDVVDDILEDTNTMEADLTTHIDGVHSTTDALINHMDGVVDTIAGDTDTMEADLKTHMDSNHATTDTLVTSSHVATDSMITDIKTKTDNLPADTTAELASIQADLVILEGVMQQVLGINNVNKVIDQQVYANARLTGARIRTFTDNSLSVVLKTYALNATYDVLHNCTLYQVVEV